jgi:phospholipid/cholesterol/gamma-HCH transport system substrate-binding protein/paraquat-inducible protein B
MSLKPNYFKIGVFVIAAIVLILVAIVIFGSGLFTQDKVYLETYFDGSVSGLDIGAPVEFMGVRMGQVEKITFALSEYEMAPDSENYYNYGDYVLVLASIDVKNLPADLTLEENSNVDEFMLRGFRLRLASNILTGQAYLQGEILDPNRYPVLKVPWEPRHYYVSSAQGEFTTMKQSIDNILHQLEQIDTKRIGDLVAKVLISLDKAVDDANIPEISHDIRSLIADADKAVDDVNVPAISNQIQDFLTEARETNVQLQELLKRPEKTDSQMANIAAMVANLNRTLLRIDRLVMSQSPKIEQALEDLREVTADLKEITGSLKQQPSQLILSQPPPKSEVSK